jgi:hypothetical protein
MIRIADDPASGDDSRRIDRVHRGELGPLDPDPLQLRHAREDIAAREPERQG